MESFADILTAIKDQIEKIPTNVRTQLEEDFNTLIQSVTHEFEDNLTKDDFIDQVEDDSDFSRKVFNARLETEKALSLHQTKLSIIEDKITNIIQIDDLLKNDINSKEENALKLNQTAEELKRQDFVANDQFEKARKLKKEKTGVIEQKVNDMNNSVFNKEKNYLIIKYLLEQKHCKHPLYDVILEMKDNEGIHSIIQLASASNVSSERIDHMFRDLRDFGIMSYDQNRTADNFRFTTEIEF